MPKRLDIFFQEVDNTHNSYKTVTLKVLSLSYFFSHDGYRTVTLSGKPKFFNQNGYRTVTLLKHCEGEEQ